MKKYFILNICFLMILSLQGCMNVATTSAQAVMNRQNIQKNFKDQYLTLQAYKALYVKTKEFSDTNISISTYDREILLAGQAPTLQQKKKAENIVHAIPDVKKIYNLVTIQSPSSALTHMSDAWITGKIKAKLLASNDVDATQVKVVTENGVVYLMGTLFPEQADAAVDIASNTQGVLSVVKIFYYLKISKNPNA